MPEATPSNAVRRWPRRLTIYTFEGNGNETGAGSTTYAYDLENRMVSATVGGATTTFGYDGDGNRRSSTTSGTTTDYLWDVNEPLALLALERSGGSTVRDYSYGAGLNSMTTGGSNFFYLLDAYSGVANLTSSSGATEWTYASDPFGTGTATKNDPSAPANLMRFDGQFLDSATGLYNLRARTYDPTLGRFLQIDPLPQDPTELYITGYEYTGDRPTFFEDPSGMSLGDLFHKVSRVAIGPVNFARNAAGDWVSGAVAMAHQAAGIVASGLDTARSVGRRTLEVLSVIPYAQYYVTYRVIRFAHCHLGVAGQILTAPLVPLETEGLAKDVVIDLVKGRFFADESVRDEGRRGHLLPFELGPIIYLYGWHANGKIDFEW